MSRGHLARAAVFLLGGLAVPAWTLADPPQRSREAAGRISAPVPTPAGRPADQAVPAPAVSKAPPFPGDLPKPVAATGDDSSGPFAPRNWMPPPPPPPPYRPPPPPPPPTAPALPFRFVGMMEGERAQAFLARGEELLIVKGGEEIAGRTYRVDSVSPTTIVFTYLPLKQKQILNIQGGTP